MPRPLTLEPLPSTQRQLNLTPETREKLDRFAAHNPFLVETIQQMPREVLEEQLLLDRMVHEEIKESYSNRILDWLNSKLDSVDALGVRVASSASSPLRPSIS